MWTKLAAGAGAGILAAPAALLLMIAVLLHPAATAACTTSGLNVGPVPDSLTATTKDGATVTLDKTQLTHAATIITVAGPASGYGNLVVIEHNIGGQIIASAYGHMETIDVPVGDLVTAGQHIADVGSEGHSTGPHLHFEIRPGGTNATAVDSDAWLKAHDAEGIAAGDATPAMCTATGSAS
ncbi:M23 family metallopeptidase [Propionibacterium freudenreichii]|uniref:M23 family metallopeptidase n=1 Tax=Propionibacterium freudenreichii TaxID=1744 RepID=UPI0005CC71D4|nr:M23 family metallopeptidase [Propionibacterium freudenreichii]SBN42970.1 Hypothetical protein PFR_J18_632 [Propionibacterium freudenreichii]SBT28699.1 Hypothetical protein PFR_JS14_562 [Propionibacterium freudenreichii]